MITSDFRLNRFLKKNIDLNIKINVGVLYLFNLNYTVMKT